MLVKPLKKEIEDLSQSLWMLVVDDNQYSRYAQAL
jgi:hypothetical protein